MIQELKHADHVLQFGKEKIPFTINFSRRKRLSISVYPDKSVKVNAPEKYTLDDILPKVEKRAAWVLKQQNYFDQFHPLPVSKEHVNGETHHYLGRQYRLKVVQAKKEEIRLKDGFFHIQTRNRNNSDKIKQLLWQWYAEKALYRFTFRLDDLYQSFKKYHIKYPKLKIKDMKKRWGSCSKSGVIVLNLKLIQAPSHCIDYVIVHELCHLIEHNHSPKYYKLLDRMMPDWRERKKRLESVLI